MIERYLICELIDDYSAQIPSIKIKLTKKDRQNIIGNYKKVVYSASNEKSVKRLVNNLSNKIGDFFQEVLKRLDLPRVRAGKTIIIIALVILSLLFGKAFLYSFYFTDSWKYEVTPYNGEPKTLTIHITQEELSEYPCFAKTLQTADENGLTYIYDFNVSGGALSEYWSWLESLNIEYYYPFIIETDSGDYLVHLRTFGGSVSDNWWLGYMSLLCLLTIPLLLFRWSRQT